jgi:DNA-binding NarL/FixJ family response regulator
VAQALLRGHSQREIAQQRSTSVRTVANQVQSIYRKYGVRSREELALVLIAGLPPPDAHEPPE